MQVDQAAWKRLTTRTALLEDAVEILLDQNAGLIGAVQIIAKRLGHGFGADPMCAALCGPAMRPRIMDGTQIESLPEGLPGFYQLALDVMPDAAKAEYDRQSKTFSELRKLRREREMRRLGVSVKTSPGGGALGGATDGPQF